MTKTSKIALSVLAAGATALSIHASPIAGTISFSGNVTPYTSYTGTGTIDSDYTTAHSIMFNVPTVVNNGAFGSFAGIAVNTPVTMYSPLLINPTVVPAFPMWSVSGFTFTLLTLTEPVDMPTYMILQGTGTMADGNPADSTMGTWIATFSSSPTGGGVTFGWEGGTTSVVPDSGTSLLLLGLSLTALGAFAQFRKQVVA